MSRPQVVLVPGLLCNRDLFRDQIAHLAPRAEVMVGDHTRHAGMAEIAASILAAAPPRFSLAGLSVGGYIAMEMAMMAPVTSSAWRSSTPRPGPTRPRSWRGA